MNENFEPITQTVLTTPGRMLISEILPKHPKVSFEIINKVLTKKEISNAIDLVYRHCGQKKTVIFARHFNYRFVSTFTCPIFNNFISDEESRNLCHSYGVIWEKIK